MTGKTQFIGVNRIMKLLSLCSIPEMISQRLQRVFRFSQMKNQLRNLEGARTFLVACYATLYPALSVGWSVGWSVVWSVPSLLFRRF